MILITKVPNLLAMDDDLFVPFLQKLAATYVSISRQYILQMSVTSLRITASHSVYYEEDENGFLATVQIHVPAHENIPQFKTTIFAGQYCQTTEAALESASLAALLYMQKANILIVHDLNFPELQKCQREVVRARSWSDIFQHEVINLNAKIKSLERELASLKESSAFLVPVQEAEAAEESDHQDNGPQLIMLWSNEEFAEAGSITQASAALQAPAPHTEDKFTQLAPIAKKPKENSSSDNLLLSATTSADKLPSDDRTLAKKDGLGTRRALFASKKEAMDA